MTDDLIGRLSTDVKPVRSGAIRGWLIAAAVVGVVVSAALMISWIGMRNDLDSAWTDPIFWMKFGYTLLVALGGFWAVERLSRPGASGRTALLSVLAVFIALGGLAVLQMMMAPREEVLTLVLGGTWDSCPLIIVALALPILIATMLAMRRLAPTNLPLAGMAAGLLAGGAGAWVYAFHCGEYGLPFLAIWYTLGIAITAAVGSVAGRWLLRW
jgi:hypothetical protein